MEKDENKTSEINVNDNINKTFNISCLVFYQTWESFFLFTTLPLFSVVSNTIVTQIDIKIWQLFKMPDHSQI